MKKHIFKTLIITGLVSLFSSCAMHTGYMANSASLGTNNFTYVARDVKASASAVYVFGIGGLSKRTLVDKAKRDMLRDNPLKDNQALANITVNWASTFVMPIYWSNKCTVTADIVEFK